MPDFQNPKAKKLQNEAIALYSRAEAASEPEKSDLMRQGAEKEREADKAESGR